MLRRVTMSALAIGLLTASMGCRSSCGERRGLFGCKTSDPCHNGSLMGFSGKAGGIDCYGGEPVPGQLMSFPGNSGVPVMPAPSTGLPNELPMPQPSELIPGQRIPYAPPSQAPAPLDATMTGKGMK